MRIGAPTVWSACYGHAGPRIASAGRAPDDVRLEQRRLHRRVDADPLIVEIVDSSIVRHLAQVLLCENRRVHWRRRPRWRQRRVQVALHAQTLAKELRLERRKRGWERGWRTRIPNVVSFKCSSMSNVCALALV
eukprot:674430-Prymnesium_polylepis.1